jgi:hypothetical protein
MSWEDATTLSVYTHSFGTSTVPDSIKQDAVRCYHEKQRAREEVGRLQSEMKNCADHYATQRSCLLQARKCLQDTGAQDTYTLGSICLLTQRIRLCQQQIVNFIAYANDDTKGSMDEPGAACVSQQLQRTEESEEYLVPEEHKQLLEPGEESLRLVEEPSQNNKDTDTEDETDEKMEIQSWRGERYLREQFLKNPTTLQPPDQQPCLDGDIAQILPAEQTN